MVAGVAAAVVAGIAIPCVDGRLQLERRYLLVVLPGLGVLAGAGLSWATSRLSDDLRRTARLALLGVAVLPLVLELRDHRGVVASPTDAMAHLVLAHREQAWRELAEAEGVAPADLTGRLIVVDPPATRHASTSRILSIGC